MSQLERIYIGRDNRIARELTHNGQPLSTTDKLAVTRVKAYLGDDICFDTDGVNSQYIEYVDGAVYIQPGLLPDLEPGESLMHLTVYDAAHPHGFAFGFFPVEIIDWPKCEQTEENNG